MNWGESMKPRAMPTTKNNVTNVIIQAWNLILLKQVLITVSIGIKTRIPRMISAACSGLIKSCPLVTVVLLLAPSVELPRSGNCDVGFVCTVACNIFMLKLAYAKCLRSGASTALVQRGPNPVLPCPIAHINGACVDVKSSGGLDQ